MTAEVSPITDATSRWPRSSFGPITMTGLLGPHRVRLRGRIRPPITDSCSVTGERVVGVLLALYSERLVAGRLERFCNMGSWCVLPEYRGESMSLLNAMLAQEGFHFTSLSPPKEGASGDSGLVEVSLSGHLGRSHSQSAVADLPVWHEDQCRSGRDRTVTGRIGAGTLPRPCTGARRPAPRPDPWSGVRPRHVPRVPVHGRTGLRDDPACQQP